MQTQSHKDVVKNITSASQLEGELQLSQAQHGVAVLDVYNAEWGNCKALSETFRRLSTDAGDMVHLRFFSVECNAVLESLHGPDDAKASPRPKGMEFSPETLNTFWSKMLEERQNHSKPYFAFYKEGKMRTHLEGIDTPKICRIVHDLCKQQNAAAEYITNQDALNFWESNFSPSENEVGTNEFVHATRKLLGAAAADLSSDDFAHIVEAVHGGGGGGGDVVSASHLQSFAGDTATVKDALLVVIAKRRAETGAAAPPQAPPAPAAAEAAPAAAPRTPSPPHGGSQAADNTGADDAADAHPPQAHYTPVDNDESPEELDREGEKAAAQEEEELDGDDVTAAATDAAALHATETMPPADVMEISDGDNDDNDNDASAHEPAEEDEEAEAASAIAESSAPPPSAPEGVSAERDRELEQPASSAPAETAPSPSPPESALHADDDDEEGLLSASSPPAVEQDESTVNQIFTNRWVTVSEEEMHVWNTVAALPLHYPESTTLMADLSNDETAARAALPTSPETFPTLAEHLAAQGVPSADVNMMCIAADQKVGSESLSYGKLSLILMSCDSEVSKGLVPECELFLSELSAGTLLSQHQPLAFTALALSASEAYPDECFYYCFPNPDAAVAFRELSENDVFLLNALTPLNTAAPADGVFALRIIGLPKVIELATTDESDDTMVLSQWFARLRVVEQGADAITVHFVENACDEEFQGFLSGYIARLIEDENRLDKKQGEVPAEAAAEAEAEEPADGAYEIGDDAGEEAGNDDDDDAGEYEEDAEPDSAKEL